MNWKEFFRLKKSKIIIFIFLLLLFGVPDFVRNCAAYDFGRGEFPCGPTRLGLNNILFYGVMLDAVDIYAFNPVIIVSYLMLLYSFLSLIYFYSDKKRINLLRVVVVTILIALFIILMLWVSTRPKI